MNNAVLVGINSYQHVSGLNGCVNDVEDVAGRLLSTNSVAAGNIVKLLDGAATKAAIVSAIQDALGKLKFGERAYLHFSGHGVQLPSDDPEEPDGLDEVLCAYDFDWTAATAVADDELYRLLLERAPGSEVLVTIDSCHSGDQLRALLPRGPVVIRTLPAPQRIRAKLSQRAAVRSLRSIARGPGVAFMSACSPWEVAADTSFDGRANGAFTYHLLREEQITPAGTYAQIVTALKANLVNYRMTPVAEGEVGLTWVAPADRALTKRLPGDAVHTPALVRGSEVLFERTFDATFAGQRVALEVRITADNGQCLLFSTVSILGASIAVPPIAVSGNQQLEVPLGVLGARLGIGVSGWEMASGSLRFDLDLSVVTGMWFVPPVHLGQVPISLPAALLTRAAMPMVATPADLAALLALRGQTIGSGREPGSVPRGYRDPRLQVFAGDVAKWGPNWSEDRVIRPFANTPRPEGIQRSHVEIGPQRGAGNVYVVGWNSPQETDFDFVLHMGNNFFGGWGEIDWRVVGFYYDESPFPRGLAAPAKASRVVRRYEVRAIADDFAMPDPEGGGSVRV